MRANIIRVDTVDKLDAIIEASEHRPVFLFKHSNSCGISSDIFEQVGGIDGDIHVIVVQADRAVSNAAAERLGIRHASPQAFVLLGGRPIYHATHYGINPAEIERKLKGESEK